MSRESKRERQLRSHLRGLKRLANATLIAIAMVAQGACGAPRESLSEPIVFPATAVTVPPQQFVQPVAEAAAVRFASWSPTSDWLAYWLSTDEQATSGTYPFPAGTLNFLNVRTQQACAEPRFVERAYEDRLVWKLDGQVIVVTAGAAMQGYPCTNDYSDSAVPEITERDADPGLSPNGDYRAETMSGESLDGVVPVTTTIVSATDARVVNTTSWTIWEEPGGLGLGGTWVTDDQFLISSTLDRGPLLMEAETGTIQVAPELFKTPFVAGSGNNLVAFPFVVPDTSAFHLVLQRGANPESDSPFIKVFHSESGVIEEFPFTQLWGPAVSPDGRWLLFDDNLDRDGHETSRLWVRAVETVGGESRYVGEGHALWTTDWSMVAFGLDSSISVLAFPDGTQLGTWQVRRFDPDELWPARALYPEAWSPDGRFVAVEGSDGEREQALFVVDAGAVPRQP